MLAEQLGIVGAKVKGRRARVELFEQIRRDRRAAGCRSGS
jgi:hypothetical protein